MTRLRALSGVVVAIFAVGCAALVPPPDVRITCLEPLGVAECNRLGRFGLANAPEVIARNATEVEIKPARILPGKAPGQVVQIWTRGELMLEVQVTILPDGRLWTYTPGATPP